MAPLRFTKLALRSKLQSPPQTGRKLRGKIYYSPETDSLRIKLRTGEAGVVGEIMDQDLTEIVVLHRDDADTLYEMEVVGLPVGVFPASRQESKAV